jgi:hypothetical protein
MDDLSLDTFHTDAIFSISRFLSPSELATLSTLNRNLLQWIRRGCIWKRRAIEEFKLVPFEKEEENFGWMQEYQRLVKHKKKITSNTIDMKDLNGKKLEHIQKVRKFQ